MTIENEGAFVGDFEIPYHFPGRYFLTILDLAVQFLTHSVPSREKPHKAPNYRVWRCHLARLSLHLGKKL